MFNRSQILVLVLLFFLVFATAAVAGSQDEPGAPLSYSDARTFNNNGVDLVAKAKYQDAAKEFEKALAVDPDFHAARYNLALAHYNMGKVKESIAEFQRLVNGAYYFVNAHYNLGTIYLREGMVDKAIEQLKIVEELEPGHAEAHFNLGYIYFNRNQLDDAADEYKKGLGIKPDSAKGHLSLAFIYEKKGMYKEAADEYQAVLKIEPDHQNARQAAGGLQAVAKIKESLAANPKDASAYAYLGHIYYARGMYSEARDSYDKSLQIDPQNKTVKEALGKAAAQLAVK